MEIGCEFRGKLGGMSFTFLQVSKDGEKIGEERGSLRSLSAVCRCSGIVGRMSGEGRVVVFDSSSITGIRGE